MGGSDEAPWQGAHDEGQTRIAPLRCSRLQRCRLRDDEREQKGRKEDGKEPAVCSLKRDKTQREEGDSIAREGE